MSTAREVPQTRGELEGDDALQTLRECGRRQLLLRSAERFRAADGFSHARSLAFSLALTLLPALIAIVGLSRALEAEQARKIIEQAIRGIAPGETGDVLLDAGRQGDGASSAGWTAVAAGVIAAISAGTTAMAQLERGANRIYGVERDRPFVKRYGIALILALIAGSLFAISVTLLVAGAGIRHAAAWGDGLDTAWEILRWPFGLAAMVAAMALLFEVAPNRRQPEPTWLAFGAAVSAILWVVFLGLLDLYVELAGGFQRTYGAIAGTIGLLVWSFLIALAVLLGLAVAAQLEAERAGVPDPRVDRVANSD